MPDNKKIECKINHIGYKGSCSRAIGFIPWHQVYVQPDGYHT